MGVLEGAIYGKEWCDVDPNELVLIWGVVMSMSILVKIDKKCDRESTNRRTDRRTDANRFYNLSYARLYAIAMGQTIKYTTFS